MTVTGIQKPASGGGPGRVACSSAARLAWHEPERATPLTNVDRRMRSCPVQRTAASGLVTGSLARGMRQSRVYL